MLENIAIEIAEELNNAGINAVTAFNASELGDVSAFVCVGIKSARISSSGLGNCSGARSLANRARSVSNITPA